VGISSRLAFVEFFRFPVKYRQNSPNGKKLQIQKDSFFANFPNSKRCTASNRLRPGKELGE